MECPSVYQSPPTFVLQWNPVQFAAIVASQNIDPHNEQHYFTRVTVHRELWTFREESPMQKSAQARGRLGRRP
jgi:hypothetical protein